MTFIKYLGVLLAAMLLTNKVVYSQASALRFSGNNTYVNIPNNPCLNLNGVFTIEAWVKWNGKPNSNIIDKGNYDYSWEISPIVNDGKLCFYNRIAGTWFRSDSAIPVNKWTHVAVTLQANRTLTFYINGAYSGLIINMPTTQDVGEINIGRQQPAGCQCNFFGGQISEVRIWNIAERGDQIRATMNTSVHKNSFGLVEYYKLNEGGGKYIVDESPCHNNGVVMGTAPVDSLWGPGITLGEQVGLALDFTGGFPPYINIPNSPALNVGGSYTFEAWVNWRGLHKGVIIDKRDRQYVWAILNPNVTDGKLAIYNKASHTWYQSNTDVPRNTWTHVAVTLQDSSLVFYINGQAAGTFAHVPYFQGTGSMTIGQMEDTLGYNFNGQIDELRIWNRARTQSQIQAAMNYTVADTSAGLAAYYKMDEGTGDSLADASVYHNNGKIALASWVYGMQLPELSKPVYAVNFAGANNVEVPSAASTSIGTFTLETWVKWNGDSASALCSKGGSFIWNLVKLSPTEGQLGLCAFVYSNPHLPATPVWRFSGGDIVIPVNVWTHVAVTIGGGQAQFYINGRPCGTPIAMVVVPAGQSPLTLGAEMNFHFLNGQMKEFRMWNVVRTPGQILACMNASLPGNTPGLVICYKMNEGQGIFVRDATANHNNGLYGKYTTVLNPWASGIALDEFKLSPARGNYALQFGDKSYVKIPNTLYELGINFTVEAWVYYRGNHQSTILDQGNKDFVWQVNPDNSGRVGFYNKLTQTWYYSSSVVPLNQWTFLAISYGGTAPFTSASRTLTFYKNAVPDGSYPNVQNRHDYGPASIGTRLATGDFFDGMMDNFAVWQKARSQTDIYSDMTSPTWGVPGVSGYYMFNEGEGNYTADQSGLNNTAVLVNATWRYPGKNITETYPTQVTGVSAPAPSGQPVTVSGAHFSASAVFFGNTLAATTTVNGAATGIAATVPPGVLVGPVKVSNLATGGGSFSPLDFVPTFAPAKSVLSATDFSALYAAGGSASSIVTTAIADFDGDGRNDIVSGDPQDIGFPVFKNLCSDTNVAFGRALFPFAHQASAMSVCDINGDGKPDVIIATRDSICIFRNTSQPGYLSFATVKSIPAPGSVDYDLKTADLDGDGWEDMMLTYSTGVYLYRNITGSIDTANISFTPPVQLSGMPPSIGKAVICDLNGDYHNDLAMVYTPPGDTIRKIAIYLNYSTAGNLSFLRAPVTLDAERPTVDIAYGDLDHDYRPELIVSNSGRGTISVYRNTTARADSMSFGPKVNFNISPPGTTLGASWMSLADFTGNGKPDIAVSTNLTVGMSILRNISTPGNIALATPFQIPIANSTAKPAIGDINGDGKPDIIAPTNSTTTGGRLSIILER